MICLSLDSPLSFKCTTDAKGLERGVFLKVDFILFAKNLKCSTN